ncbi:MAG: YaaA family protein [Firmicutes bacterium]|nr:YaaA family protein [Bacillota bacterium]
MKIILSPSKTLSLVCPLSGKGKELLNEKKSIYLMKAIKDINKEQLGKVFKIKDKLLDETYNLYQNSKYKDLRYDPIGCYNGVVYKLLGNKQYSHDERNYLENNIVILSAMFGLIEPGQGIWPYRLDFKTKPKGLNLYEYWRDDVLEYFKDESIIINLASGEFSSLLKPIENKLVNINFIETDGRILSFRAKKARGIMADAIICNKVKKIGEMKKFIIDGYIFNEEISDDKNYFYIKGGKLL